MDPIREDISDLDIDSANVEIERAADNDCVVDKVVDKQAEEDTCWICLQSGIRGKDLKQHCSCHRMVAHDACIAHWQLRNAGKSDELACRRCKTPLPNWKDLALQDGKKSLAKFVTLAVQVNGKVKYMKVKLGGQEKVDEFRDKLRRAFGLPDTLSLDIDFTVQNPFAADGDVVKLSGLDSYTAAIHCGAILDKENERKEACSYPEGIRSPASQSNPNDSGNGDGDDDEGENATEESAQSEAAGNDNDDGASSDFESIEDVDQTDLECVCTDRYERMRIRRRQRVLREQAELSLDTQVSEKLVDPDLAVGSDRTQRHGNATALTWRASPGPPPKPSCPACSTCAS